MSERAVKLTHEQVKEIRHSSRVRNAKSKLLWELFEQLAEGVAESDLEFWEQVHQVCGTEDGKHHLKINWITGEVLVTDIDPLA
jgi:predicted component of type VI protein secretion system